MWEIERGSDSSLVLALTVLRVFGSYTSIIAHTTYRDYSVFLYINNEYTI